jgi:ubiquinone/menaquinone biosynthesis C-methylase UbiE
LIDDKTAEKFARYMKKYPDLYQNLADIVKKYATNAKPVIIDLGVGPGLLSQELCSQIPNATIIGVDPDKKMLSLAQQNACFDTFEARLGSSENIPVDDDSADIVVSRFSLTYWKDQKKSFSEMFRVLKKDGCVILEVINKDFPVWRLFLIKVHMLFNKAGADVTKYHVDVYKDAYTIDQVEQFLTDAKFSIVEKEGNKKGWKFLIVGKKK